MLRTSFTLLRKRTGSLYPLCQLILTGQRNHDVIF
jgi:hypothetical protein